MPQEQVPVSLANICDGNLERMFQDVYPALVSQLKHGEKAAIAIKLEFKRVQNTQSMLSVKATLTPRFPAKAKETMAFMDEKGVLTVEKLPEAKGQLTLLDGGKA